jgi:AcrR family transcriptional regulator
MDRTAAPNRSSAATRAALIEAAGALFSKAGYDSVGVRELAERAGVNAALVNRYFGSKLGLLTATVEGRFHIGALLVGDPSTLGDRLARFLVLRKSPDGLDPTRLMLRSAASAEAGPMLREAVATQVVQPLATWLAGEDAHERAIAIASVIFGVGMTADALAPDPAPATNSDILMRHLGAVLQRLIDGA